MIRASSIGIYEPAWFPLPLSVECYPPIGALQPKLGRPFRDQPAAVRPVGVDDQRTIDETYLQRRHRRSRITRDVDANELAQLSRRGHRSCYRRRQTEMLEQHSRALI